MNAYRIALASAAAACALVLLAGCTQPAASGSASGSDPSPQTASSSSQTTSSTSSTTSSTASPSAADSSGSATAAPSSSASSDGGDVVAVLDGNIMAAIYLDYNAGTGFEWQCSVDDESVVGILSQETRDESGDEPITGGPLCDVVTVAAGNPGTATVTCSLVRPWETGVEPAETQTFVFEVDGAGQMSFNAKASDCIHKPEFLTLS